MPDAVIVQIADAVVSALNDGSFSQSFTAARSHDSQPVDLDTLSTLDVKVIPYGIAGVWASRVGVEEDYQVDVVFHQKADIDSNAVVDPLMRFWEELRDFFLGDRLTGYTDAICVSAEALAIYDKDFMRTKRLFGAGIRFAFRVYRDVN